MASFASAVRDEPASPATRRAPVRSSVLAGWHLWSLDAPTVACLWTWFSARAAGLPCPGCLVGAMGLVVWALYAADRLLDARVGPGRRAPGQGAGAAMEDSGELEERHYFHHRHRRVFLTGICVALGAAAALLTRVPWGLLRAFSLEGVGLLAWFWLVHWGDVRWGNARLITGVLRKEVAVGLFFASAVFLPVVWRAGGEAIPGLLFAAVLMVNGFFIDAWEHKGAGHGVTASCGLLGGVCLSLALAGVPALAGGPALAGVAGGQAGLAEAACALSCGALLALHRRRDRIERTTLRAAADAALLTPLLLLPLLPR